MMQLPGAIQAHLAGTELTDLKELAQMADCLWLCYGPQPVVAIQVEEEPYQEDSEEVVSAIPCRRQATFKKTGQQGQKKGCQES